MTKTKIERLRQETIDKYGDIVLVRIFRRDTHELAREIKLSEAAIHNTAEWKAIEKIIRNRKPCTVTV